MDFKFMLHALLFSQLLTNIAAFQEVQEYIATVENGGPQSDQIKAQLQQLDASIHQEMFLIGNLRFLVIKTSQQISFQIKALQGVLNVEANVKVEAFSPMLSSGRSTRRFGKKGSARSFIGFTPTENQNMSQRIEKQDYCYERDTGTILWGLTRIAQR